MEIKTPPAGPRFQSLDLGAAGETRGVVRARSEYRERARVPKGESVGRVGVFAHAVRAWRAFVATEVEIGITARAAAKIQNCDYYEGDYHL